MNALHIANIKERYTKNLITYAEASLQLLTMDVKSEQIIKILPLNIQKNETSTSSTSRNAYDASVLQKG